MDFELVCRHLMLATLVCLPLANRVTKHMYVKKSSHSIPNLNPTLTLV
jgi:hypothetical protein